MGLFSTSLRITALENPERQSEPLAVLVDTGAVYPVIPEGVLTASNVKKNGSITITLADGRQESREYGYAFFILEGRRVPNMVLFGKSSDMAILGVTVLEQAGFCADPVHQKLIPVAPIQA